MTMDICGVILKFEYAMMMPKTNRWGSMLNTLAITLNRISVWEHTGGIPAFEKPVVLQQYARVLGRRRLRGRVWNRGGRAPGSIGRRKRPRSPATCAADPAR